jgi:hypothetical protein
VPHPFVAAYYSKKCRSQIDRLAVTDLDTAEHLWGGIDSTIGFRNMLVGPPGQRGELWQQWITSGDMEIADDPAYYVLHTTQDLAGQRIDRWALYCSLDIFDPSLFIHEDTLPEGVERARQGTEACESDLAPIFVGCEEALGESFRQLVQPACGGKAPLIEFAEGDGAQHRIWPLEGTEIVAEISRLFQGVPLFLLDGHHRLAAARENHRLGMGDGGILACVCSMKRSDTLILPIHRVVHYERWMLPDAMCADIIRAGGRLTELRDLKVSAIQSFIDEQSAKSGDPFCVVLHSHGDKAWLVELPTVAKLPPALAKLPVACLDVGVLGEYKEATPIPVPNFDLALEQLALDQAQAAFFLPPSSAAQVRAVALAQLKMPRKSTRFVPKPVLGLICRPWVSSG